MINRITELNEFKWISESHNAQISGNYRGLLIPPYFESYCLILHPIYLNKRAEIGPRIPWVEMSSEERHKIGKIDSLHPIQGKRIRWRQLAEENGMVFHPEINIDLLFDISLDGLYPLRLYGPSEGSLDEPMCKELIQVLKSFTGNQTHYFIDSRETGNDNLYTCDLEDITQFSNLNNYHKSPTYWWPKDHSWCLYSPLDSSVTILGGSKELINSVLLNTELEVLNVDINYDGRRDRINEKQFCKLIKRQKIKEFLHRLSGKLSLRS